MTLATCEFSFSAAIPHDMRRSSIRNVVRAGLPERVSIRMSGHKTRPTFERYDIVSDGDLKDAARRIDVASRLANHLAGKSVTR